MLRLEITLSVPEGRERDAAIDLKARLPEPHWRLLAAIAAEIVAVNESATGAAVLVVAGGQAETVLADLGMGSRAVRALRAALGKDRSEIL